MSCQLLTTLEDVIAKVPQRLERMEPHNLEKTISNVLSALLQEAGYRTASLVNPRRFVRGLPPGRREVMILQTFRHPLQPDVDLLVEDKEDDNKLWGVEIKLIHWKGSIFNVTPKGRLYTGLDQALAIATYGIDYACLCQVFIPPMTAYRRTFEAQGPKLAEQLDDDRIEFTAAYEGLVKGILEHFHLPIGYIAMGLFSDQTAGTVEAVPLKPWRAPTALIPTETGSKVRTLLLKALG